MSGPELLPCPFCGGEAFITTNIMHGPIDAPWHVGCNRAMKDGTWDGCCTLEWFSTAEEAIAAWNRRADMASPLTAVAMREAAASECDSIRESYRRSRSQYAEDDPQYRLIKYAGAAAAVCAENIRAIAPQFDHAAILAAALALPEIAGLVEAVEYARLCLSICKGSAKSDGERKQFDHDIGKMDSALAALQKDAISARGNT